MTQHGNRFLKALLGCLIAVLLLFIVLAAFLPTLASTDWGRRQLLSFIEPKVSGSLNAQKLDLHWLSGQRIEGLEFHDAKNNFSMTMDSFSTDTGLLKLLFHKGLTGMTKITGLNAQAKSDRLPPAMVKNVNAELNMDSDPLTLHATGETLQGNLTGHFTVDSAIAKSELIEILNGGQEQKGKFELKVDARNLPVDFFDQLAALSNPSLAGLLKKALGDKLDLAINKIPSDEGVSLRINLRSPIFLVNGILSIPWNSDKLGLTLQGEAAQNGQPIKINVESTFDKTFQSIEAEVNANGFVLRDLPTVGSLEVNDLKIALGGDTLEGMVGSLSAQIKPRSQQGILNAIIGTSPVLLTIDPQPIGKIQNLSSFIFTGQIKLDDSTDLAAILGSDLKLTLGAQDKLKVVDLLFSGQQLEAKASFAIDDAISIRNSAKPALLRYKLTPERFKALRKMLKTANSSGDEIELLESSEVKVQIDSLNFPLKSSWMNAGISGHMTIDALNAKDRKTGEKLTLERIIATASSQMLAKKIDFNLKAKQLNGSNPSSDLGFSGFVERGFTDQGRLNLTDLSLSLTAKVTDLPVALLCRLICLGPEMHERVEALFGPAISADVDTKMQRLSGPIQAKISGKNGHVDIDGKLNNGVLTLNRNFNAQFALTPLLGRTILQEIFPIGSGLIGAENPLTISVDANGFALPLKPFDLSKIKIGLATLDLGKVHFNRASKLAEILSLLNVPYTDQISVWFTPLYLRMNEGVLKIERVDLLITDCYHIATWGKLNFPADKVSMIIGLTGQALSKAFKVHGLVKDDMLQLPLKGPINNPALDKSKAMAKIATLVAQNHGTPGKVISAVLQIATGTLGEKPAPQPTTNPLPWGQLDD